MKIHIKTALITGASTGIGQLTAISLALKGIKTIITARSLDKLKETQYLINNSGGESIIIQADLSNISSTKKLIEIVQAHTDRINYICNIAGIWHGDNMVYAGIDYDKFDQKIIMDTINVGLATPMLLTHGLIPIMTKNSTIVNISGTFESGAKGWLPYFVSKRALEDFTVGLSQELKDKQIAVFGVSPSDTATKSYTKYFPQFLKDAEDPQVVADFITDLCVNSDQEKSGQIYVLKKNIKPFAKFHA